MMLIADLRSVEAKSKLPRALKGFRRCIAKNITTSKRWIAQFRRRSPTTLRKGDLALRVSKLGAQRRSLHTLSVRAGQRLTDQLADRFEVEFGFKRWKASRGPQLTRGLESTKLLMLGWPET